MRPSFGYRATIAPDPLAAVRRDIIARHMGDVTSDAEVESASALDFEADTVFDVLPRGPHDASDCDAPEDALPPNNLIAQPLAPHQRILAQVSDAAHRGIEWAQRLADRALFAAIPQLKPRPPLYDVRLLTEMMAETVDVDDVDPQAQLERALKEAELNVPWDTPMPRIDLPDVSYVSSARDLVNFNQNPGITFMDRVRLAAPGELKLDPEDPTMLMFSAMGDAHETEVWTEIAATRDAVLIPSKTDERNPVRYAEHMERCYQDTLKAMREGRDVIGQGVLRSADGKFMGITDLLVKVQNAPGETSAFGDWHYEVRDIKLAHDAHTEHLIQLLFYADLLREIQGVLPRAVSVLNGEKKVISFETEKFIDWYDALKASYIAFNDANSRSFVMEADEPLPETLEMREHGRYGSYSKIAKRQRDSLRQVAGIMEIHVRALKAAGIRTMRDLAATELEKIPDVPDLTLAGLKEQARMQVASRATLDHMKLASEERVLLSRAFLHYVKDLAEVDVEDDRMYGEIWHLRRAAFQVLFERGKLGSLRISESDQDLLRFGKYLWGEEAARVEDIKAAVDVYLQKLIARAGERVSELKLDRPRYQVRPPDPDSPTSGLAGLPPESRNDIYSDFEGFFDRVDGKIEYLMAALTVDYSKNPRGELVFRDYWAHDPEQERKNFEALIDWWHQAWKADPTLHVYHYAPYEPAALRRLAQKYDTRKDEVEELLENHVLIDAYRLLKQGVVVGTDSYSIKKVEPLWMGKRKAKVSKATGSMENYKMWKAKPDGETWESSALLKANRDYCYEDHLSLLKCVQWLRKVQAEAGIAYVDPVAFAREREEKRAEEAKARGEHIKNKRQNARQEFFDRVARVKVGVESLIRIKERTPEQIRILNLMVQLPEYHDREARPVLWAKRQRLQMTQAELVQDQATLGNLKRAIEAPYQPMRKGMTLSTRHMFADPVDGTGPAEAAVPPGSVILADQAAYPPVKIDRSWVVAYRFNPEDGIGLEEGARYSYTPPAVTAVQTSLGFDAEGDKQEGKGEVESYECEVVKVDAESGLVRIKYGPKVWKALGEHPPHDLQLNPKRLDSIAYTYRFDPDQDTKFIEGDTFTFAHDSRITGTIDHIDFQNGEVRIVLGRKTLEKIGFQPPETLGIIPNEHVDAFPIQLANLQNVEEFFDLDNVDGKTRYLHPPLQNLFSRARARLKDDGDPTAPLVSEEILNDERRGAELEDAIFGLVIRLDGGALAIQGPPGTGKTHYLATTIVRLIQESQERRKNDPEAKPAKIGITAPNHAAARHLFATVKAIAAERGVALNGLVIGEEDAGAFAEDEDVSHAHSASRWGKISEDFEKADVVVGTAWAYSYPHLWGKLDYLFIDEAGQMALADATGAARSARNVVFAGDQRQLSNVTQGSHPGESGQSLLHYFAAGAPTLDPAKGVMLRVTHRHSTPITNVYSRPVYAGRVRSLTKTARQRVWAPRDAMRRGVIDKETGVVYVPVAHHGNKHKSAQEAERIAELVSQLIGRKYTHSDGSVRTLKLEDIMIISPYALQVKKIREKIPGANVGTVHKFQGREAPVVILSMAVSSASPYSRSIDHWGDIPMMNTALTRARALAIVVASPELENMRVRTISQMEQLSFYYNVLRAGGWMPGQLEPRIFADDEGERV